MLLQEQQHVKTFDSLWVLLAAVLVFFMQAGFKALEVGLVKASHSEGVGIKNLVDFMIGGIMFYLVGFGIMFGESSNGWFGGSFFMLQGIEEITNLSINNNVFFLFQLGFAATSLTIISGAMSGRTGIVSYLIISLFTAIFVYPVAGYWGWGNLFVTENKPWLAEMGFIDFAGSTMVHSVGAWISLVGIIMVGPRIGRFSKNGKPLHVKPSNYAYSILGLMILWMGWWGFNGGSTLVLDDSVGIIILNTNMAGISGGLVAFLHAYFIQRRNGLVEKMIGGVLSGLVAITACCHIVSTPSALIIGAIAGLMHNLSLDLLIKFRLDDSVGAIPVHGIGGIVGTVIGVPFFAKAELLSMSRMEQFGVQATGVMAIFAFCIASSYLIFLFVKTTIGLRVAPDEEVEGNFWRIRGYDPYQKIRDDLRREEEDEIDITHVSVKVSSGGFNLMPIDAFLHISDRKRSSLLDNDRVHFWDEEGSPVDKLQAMRLISSMLEDERNKITEEKDAVIKKNTEVATSINYARKIQNAVAPTSTDLKDALGDYFVLNKPRDIVSGDFYWCTTYGDKTIFAVGDCTGHGVPAGFLSMMGVAFLNDIVKDCDDLTQPNLILEQLREKIKGTLNQSEIEDNSDKKTFYTKDGMNIGLAVWDKITSKVYFSGAYHPLWLVRKPHASISGDYELHKIKGDRMPIGLFKKEESFTCQEVDLLDDDVLYMFSDGYVDQFGGEHDRKITAKGLGEVIISINRKKMRLKEQKAYLDKYLEEWRGDKKQIDDILILGVQV